MLWREQLLTLRLFRDVYELIQSHPEHVIDRDFILETIVTRMPYENYETDVQHVHPLGAIRRSVRL